MSQRNAFEVIAETLSKTDYLESAKNLVGDAKPEDTASLYVQIAQAEALTRIAAALERLAACVGGGDGKEKFWTASD